MPIEKGKLFLIPSPISENSLHSISPEVVEVIRSLDFFIVERLRTARRYISTIGHAKAIDDITFEEIPDEGFDEYQVERMLRETLATKNIGLMSEAGMPAIADPGNKYVRIAQRMSFTVVPLAGPSSIMMALMASGLEGQRFSFHGYLTAKKHDLPAQLRYLDQRSSLDDATQIWIEAPYRNKQILEAVSSNIAPERLFCIAAGLGSSDGFVKTKRIMDWKKEGWPEIHKVPAVFLIK